MFRLDVGGVCIPLKSVFGSDRVVFVEELALDGAQKLADVKRLQWQAGDPITRNEELDTARSDGNAGVKGGSYQHGRGPNKSEPGLAQLRDGPIGCHRWRCNEVVVNLEPMEIRTFKVKLERSPSAGHVSQQR